jgi:hypothetical protein
MASLIKKFRCTVTTPDKHGTKVEKIDYFATCPKQATKFLREKYGPNATISVDKDITDRHHA